MSKSEPQRLSGLRGILGDVGAALWVMVNIWGSLPVHSGNRVASTLLGVALVINPFVFGAMAWTGWSGRSAARALIWPALTVLAWLVVPALGSAYWWGWGAAERFLLRVPRWYALAYYAVCMGSYTVCAVMGHRRRFRRLVPAHCGVCGYDLTGNVSGMCPECGEKTGTGAGR